MTKRRMISCSKIKISRYIHVMLQITCWSTRIFLIPSSGEFSSADNRDKQDPKSKVKGFKEFDGVHTASDRRIDGME